MQPWWAQLWQLNLDEWETLKQTFPNIMLNNGVLQHIIRWNSTYTVTLVTLCQCHLSWLDIIMSFYYTFCKPSVFTSRISLLFVHSTLFLWTNIAKGKIDALIAEGSYSIHQPETSTKCSGNESVIVHVYSPIITTESVCSSVAYGTTHCLKRPSIRNGRKWQKND